MNNVEFINGFYQSIIDKRVDDIINAYLPSEEVYVILEGPRLATKGIEKIAMGWRDFCDSSISLKSIEWLEGPYVFDTIECVTLAGVIKLKGEIVKNTFENTFRASFVMSKTSQGLKIVQEHVSGALTDPYGIGDWKKKDKIN